MNTIFGLEFSCALRSEDDVTKSMTQQMLIMLKEKKLKIDFRIIELRCQFILGTLAAEPRCLPYWFATSDL